MKQLITCAQRGNVFTFSRKSNGGGHGVSTPPGIWTKIVSAGLLGIDYI